MPCIHRLPILLLQSIITLHASLMVLGSRLSTWTHQCTWLASTHDCESWPTAIISFHFANLSKGFFLATLPMGQCLCTVVCLLFYSVMQLIQGVVRHLFLKEDAFKYLSSWTDALWPFTVSFVLIGSSCSMYLETVTPYIEIFNFLPISRRE